MEDMGELHDQQITDSPVGGSSDLISPQELSPSSNSSISRAAVAVSIANMIDAGDFRTHLSEPTYQTLNGRMSPAYTSTSYATLTPLQPLPPISTVSDKFSHYGHTGNVSGSFTLMQNNGLGMGMNPYQYEKLGSMSGNPMSLSPPPHYVTTNNGLGLGLSVQQSVPSPLSPHSGYSQNGLHSPTKSLSPNGFDSPYTTHRSLGPAPQSPIMSVSLHLTPTSLGTIPSLNGLHTPHTPPSHLPPSGHSTPPTTREASIPSSNSNSTGNTPVSILCGGGNGNNNNGGSGGGDGGVVVLGSSANIGLVGHGLSSSSPPGTVQVTVGGSVIAGVSPPPSVGVHVTVASSAISCGGGSHKVTSSGVGLVGLTGCSAGSVLQVVNSSNSNGSTNSVPGIGGGNSGGGGNNNNSGGGGEVEEINTKELAQRISAELKRYSIPQAIFAQRVLCRSQGTLSDLLRNPKPWSKLKSGRETFRRMWKWLQEPEFQRMSALRLADGQEVKWGQQPHPQHHPLSCPRSGHFPKGKKLDNFMVNLPTGERRVPAEYEMRNVNQRAGSKLVAKRRNHYQNNNNNHVHHLHQPIDEEEEEEFGRSSPFSAMPACKRKEEQQSSPEQPPAPKKPRLVFTDLQRRTLQAIFKETKRPSKEMQITISQQLGLELSTVGNFFMNARRRSQDKWLDEEKNKSNHGAGNNTSSSNTNPSTTKAS